ncbi:MAG: AmmeMemoRadiSam system radical SAM enzyme [Hadesarchaea archaeon]|nr:AmmeMemoRadiSam system radical SAM enzyme [Hadesarchaea archaeon]MDH5685100.1 AmmeMemoRadiSam system radical SAM enzyme [Hadesarchaea archaeon]
MKKPARFWKELEEGKVQCILCPRYCIILPGKLGFCKARKNIDGKLYTLVYGSIVSMAVDPIEKKPLYHFWPGSNVFSIAVPGCNFSCLHCQNWTISQVGVEDIHYEDLSPERLIELTKHYNCKGIAHTYTEPAIATEYAIDVGKLARREDFYNVYVTNGYITIDALQELGPYLDAANVDVKAFNEDFYRKICGVPSINPVLETCEWMVGHGIHLEVTYLVVPRENDSSEEIRKFCKWVFEKLGPEVPTHFSRFYPHYKMTDRSQTPVETLERAVKIAREEGLHYIYIGNVPGHEFDNTYCPKCGELLIERYGFSVTLYELKDKQCPKCGTKINIVGEHASSKRG